MTIKGNASLILDLSYVDQSSPAFSRFKQYVDRAVAGHPDYAFAALDAAIMFKLTGQQQYADLAKATVDAQVTAAEAAIAAGRNPDVAGDSYLEVGGDIGDLAVTYAWCNPTDAQKPRWAAYADQTIFNVWHPSQAMWGTRPAPWSGWAINDPADNYYYSFIQATMFWALASNNQNLLTYLRTDRLPLLTACYNAIPGGGSLEGTGYGTSHMRLFELYQWWKDSGQGDLTNLHMTNSIDFWVHATTPDLAHFAPFGDQSRVSVPTWYDYQRRLVLEACRLTLNTSERSDGYYVLDNLRHEDASPYLTMRDSFNSRYDLIPRGTPLHKPVCNFRAAEVGAVFARTSWESNATWLAVMMGLYDQSHAHQEQGGFTLFKNTWLSVANNIWSHSGIQQTTPDKNVIRFEKNGDVQRQVPGNNAKVNVLKYNLLPVASATAAGDFHILGDITPLYSVSSGVQHWSRDIQFQRGVVTITDAMQLAAGTTGTFQLQVPVQPTIQGNVITAGHLRCTVLTPTNPTISAVDMRTVDSDYNSGWRVDIKGGTTAYKVRLETI